MLDEIVDVINEITTRDRVFGTMSSESYICMKDDKNMAALATLFILAEHASKRSVNMIEGDFLVANKKAKDEGIISASEFLLLDNVRHARNKIFHEDHYSLFIKIDGIEHPISEDETKEIILKSFMQPVFNLILKLLKT